LPVELPADCLFCRIARGELDPEVLAFRDEHTAVFPTLHQQARNPGHMLVVPTAHVAHIYEVTGELAGALMTTLARVAAAVKKAFGADGVTIRQNNERHGGQDVFHVHFHVIPRFADDRFDIGEDHFPFGAVEVPLARRAEQAARLSKALKK
jgi:histidine triad (HIT) family protein